MYFLIGGTWRLCPLILAISTPPYPSDNSVFFTIIHHQTPRYADKTRYF